jgi:CubicO group peptidase (beta-lactamase class C family)
MKRLSLHVAVVFCAITTFAAETPDKIDEYVAAEMQKQHVPGVSIAVVKNGEVVRLKGYGLANVEHQVPVEPKTIFQSGSVGKQFTAMAVMMLVEDGKLNLEDPINKYFTDAPSTWSNIRVRNLLSHTSGIPDYEQGTHKLDLRHDYTEDELLKFAEQLPLDFQPGDKWKYSNTGYVLLGILIHKVSGQFYGDVLHDRIFVPLGMSTARIISEADIVPNRAAGYQFVNGELKNQDWVAPKLNTTADGSLYLTAMDMTKWEAALRERRLLKASSYDQMWTSFILNDGKPANYGFGWFVSKPGGRTLIEHSGSWQGFKSYIGRWVDDGVTVIVFSNLDKANPTVIAKGVARLCGVPEAAAKVKD